VQQQHGIPPKQMQHMQPDFMQQATQSQQACNMSQQALSPDVQVMHTPSLVISHLQLHMVKLHWQTTMPFIMQQQLHMPLAIMRQRFCSVLQETSSSQTQVILMPPGHFSIFSLHCGTMAMLPIPVAAAGIPDIGIDELDIPVIDRGRSTIIMDIAYSFRFVPPRRLQVTVARNRR